MDIELQTSEWKKKAYQPLSLKFLSSATVFAFNLPLHELPTTLIQFITEIKQNQLSVRSSILWVRQNEYDRIYTAIVKKAGYKIFPCCTSELLYTLHTKECFNTRMFLSRGISSYTKRDLKRGYSQIT